MKNFYYHLAESIQYYKYRIRLLNDPTDQMDLIRYVTDQYDPQVISEVIRTPIQDSPLDFPNYSMVSVFIIDMELKIPVSTYILQNKIRAILNIPNSTIVVRMENDPLELETLRLNNFGDWDQYEPLLSTSPVYHEYNYHADDNVPYGDEYNTKFLKYLASLKKNRDSNVYEYVQPENTTKKDYSILKSLDNDDALDFNKNHDCVLPVYQSEVTKNEPEPANTAIHGNFDTMSRIDSKIIMKGD